MKKLLIVVDYQVDFVSGTLGNENAVAIENRIAEKIDNYRADGWDIAFTFDTHYSDYENTQEGRKLPVRHCIESSDGWQLYGKVRECKRDCDKAFWKYSFGSADLFEFLKGSEYDKIELCGVVTDICVISNAVLAKTALPECEISVDARCTASNDIKKGNEALDVMESLQIDVYNK